MTATTGRPEPTNGGAEVVFGAHADQAGVRSCELRLRVSGSPAEAERVFDQAQRYAVGAPELARPTLLAHADEQRFTHLMSGRTLDELIATGPTHPNRIADAVDQLARALAFLHDQGTAHGHVRPDLIWIDDRLTLGGLGVAQVAFELGGLSAVAHALPTRYCAPELKGSSQGAPQPWSDVYSVGVIAAELLTGKRFSEPVTGTSEAVDGLLRSATALSPHARPRALTAWARALGDALRALTVDALVPADIPAPPPSAPPWQSAPLSFPSPTPAADGSVAAPSVAPQRDRPRLRDHRPALEQIASHPEGPPPPPPSSPPAGTTAPNRGSLGIALLVAGGMLVMLVGVAVPFFLALRTARPTAGAGAVAVGLGEGGASALAPAVPPSVVSSPPIPSDSSPLASPLAPFLAGPVQTVTPVGHRRAAIPIDADTPVAGSPLAPVTLVVFGDLGATPSLRLLRRLRRFAVESGPDVRIAWRHQPRGDRPTPVVRTAVGLQLDLGSDAFWSFAEAMAKSSAPASEQALQRAVQRAGGDEQAVKRWDTAPEVVNRLDADRSLSVQFDVRTAPTVFVNGVRLEGDQLKELDRLVAEERRAGIAMIADGVAPVEVYPRRVLKNLVGVGPEIPERRCPTLADAPWRGGADPLVVLVELSDFECAFCERAQPALDQIVARYGDDVQHVWKDLPLHQHRHARAAAALGRAAFRSGGNPAFWRVHNELFANSKPLDDAELSRIARASQLDDAAMLAVRDGLHDAALEAQRAEASKLGARGIPTYFVNGIRLDGAVRGQLESVVARERERALRIVKAGVPRRKVYEALCGDPSVSRLP